MRIRSAISHSALAVAEGTLIAMLVVGLMAGTAFAGKGTGKPSGGGSTGDSTLAVQMVVDANGNDLPNYKDTITFRVSTTATTTPMVGLRCYQATGFVYDAYVALYDASWLAKELQLSSSYWDPSANADCTARLFYYDGRGREKVLTTKSFAVAP